MLLLCHIFSDAKFVDSSIDLFKSDLFVNTAVFVGNSKSYRGKYTSIIEFVENLDKNGIKNIVTLCNKHDLIICYNLDYYKSCIVNHVSSNKKIIWRFFGTEFYSLPQQQLTILSDKTKNALNINVYTDLKEKMVNIGRFFKYALKIRRTPNAEFNNAINKINYFLSFDKEEYSIIRKNWNVFPEFLELSSIGKIEKQSTLSSKNDNIVIGHSRAKENNHIDIIELFDEYPLNKKSTLIFPLSYGAKDRYYHRLIDRIKAMKVEAHILEEFLPYDVYSAQIANAKAAVINSYRQIGLGNIFIFLGNYVKLYLSERNPSYHYLNSLGFSIYSVEKDLKGDIETNNFNLGINIGEKNIKILDAFSSSNNRLNFHNTFHRTFWDCARIL